MTSFSHYKTLPENWHISFFDSASSSNDLAYAELCAHGHAAHGRCFVVDEQTKGRGRQGRTWVSPLGKGLYFSAIICPNIDRSPPDQHSPDRQLSDRQHWPSLSFMAALAVHALLSQTVKDPHHISLKWPNDVLLKGRKIAGILLEAHKQGVIIGCGLNIERAPDLPKNLTQNVTSSLKDAIALDEVALHVKPDRHLFAYDLAAHLARFYQRWQQQGPKQLIAQWADLCPMKDTPIQITIGQGMIEGICSGFGSDGQLYLLTANGARQEITTGDVALMGGET